MNYFVPAGEVDPRRTGGGSEAEGGGGVVGLAPVGDG